MKSVNGPNFPVLSRVVRTNFTVAAILDVGMRLGLVVREEGKFTFT